MNDHRNYNELLFDDTTGQSRTKLSSESGKTQLNLGYLVHPRTKGHGERRGQGFELRTDHHGALRAAQGVLISASGKSNASGNQLDRTELVNLMQMLEPYFTYGGKMIIVTHSMGGLVVRGALQKYPELKDKILGVVHGVQPVTGAPIVYRRFKAGTEVGGAMDVIGAIPKARCAGELEVGRVSRARSRINWPDENCLSLLLISTTEIFTSTKKNLVIARTFLRVPMSKMRFLIKSPAGNVATIDFFGTCSNSFSNYESTLSCHK